MIRTLLVTALVGWAYFFWADYDVVNLGLGALLGVVAIIFGRLVDRAIENRS